MGVGRALSGCKTGFINWEKSLFIFYNVKRSSNLIILHNEEQLLPSSLWSNMGQSCRLTCYCISLSGMVQCLRSDDEGLVREVLLSKESLIGSGARDPERVPTISCNKFPGFSGFFTSFADQQIVCGLRS
ncbi:hypothetical protein CDAR_595621 [Caerostris darwini]|uniref:Uncharacterized protein n=1 Tax=Caerostris darwini TaxID=1538125 RepID=A0AAV4P712_9ARAC|nr:hypothetical protein CDAR_595621 [Caerostris darwini]